MLILATFIIVMSILASPIMASGIYIHHQVTSPAALEARAVQTPDLVLSQSPTTFPITTIGFAGDPIFFNSVPSPTPVLAAAGKAGTPLAQTSSVVSQGSTTSSGLAKSSATPHTVSIQLSTPTSTGIAGTPISSQDTKSTSGIAFFTARTISPLLPNWAVLVIIVCSSLIFFALVGMVVWRVRKRRANRKDAADEEDALEFYSSYWKTKRNSNGIVGRGNINISSPLDEKVGRSSYY